MALGTYAIVTLADLKALLGFTNTDTARDALLEQCIDRASSMVETVLGFGVIARDWVEWHSADGARTVMLKNTPVNVVNLVATEFVDAMTVTPAVGVTAATVAVSLTGVTINWFDGSAQQTTTYTLAANTTVDAIVSNVSPPTGATMELVRDGPSNQLVPGAYDFVEGAATLSMAVADGRRWRVDHTTGELTIARNDDHTWSDYEPEPYRTGRGGPVGAQRVCVKYNAGWVLASVPFDIVEAVLSTARSLFLGRANDETKQSESLGDYAVSYRSEASLAGLYKGLRESLAGRMALR